MARHLAIWQARDLAMDLAIWRSDDLYGRPDPSGTSVGWVGWVVSVSVLKHWIAEGATKKYVSKRDGQPPHSEGPPPRSGILSPRIPPGVCGGVALSRELQG